MPGAIFTKNIRKDGTVDDQVVETHLAFVESYIIDRKDQFVRLQADDGGATNVEIRLSFDEIKRIVFQIHNPKQEETK